MLILANGQAYASKQIQLAIKGKLAINCMKTRIPISWNGDSVAGRPSI
jgi:hypothetical protein